MKDKLKEKREKRGELLEKMQNLFDSAEKEKRDFTADEHKEYNSWDEEIATLDEEIRSLEKMEARQKDIALEQERRKKELDKLKKEDRNDPTIEVTAKNLKTKEARDAKVFSMIQGKVIGDAELEKESRQALADAGFYDDINDSEKRAGFATNSDGKGGVFIPTVVSDEIITISQEFGVIPRRSLNLGNILQDDVKVPQVLSRPSFTAVNQGSAIAGSGFNLGGITLKARKWGTIIDWTNEVSESIGAKLMPIIYNQLGESFAEVQDQVFFIGDGTSTYHGIKGLEELTGSVNYVRTATAVSDHDSFAELDADDWLIPQQNVAPGARSGAIYVMHPNQKFNIMKLQDGQGQYIYGAPSNVNPVETLWGHPVEYSEAFQFTDGATKTAGAFFNPRYVAFATGRSMTFKLLDQASITNEDGNTVNLATTDAMALRVTGLFDLVMSSVTRTTAGTAQGAFSVLRTYS